MTPLRIFAVCMLLAVPASATRAHALPHASAAALGNPAASGAGTAGREKDAVDRDVRQASEVLDGLKRTYRYLDGVEVSFGPTPHGEVAVAYYTTGQIVISNAHSVGLKAILSHEIWHIIDWRDNRRLDWGEDLPPNDSYAYIRRGS